MTEDEQDLIEHIRQAMKTDLERLVRVMNLSDPVERFKRLDDIEHLSLGWAIPRAKALIINELRSRKGPLGSYQAVGDLLGLSAQRVHQLAKPDLRRSNGRNQNG